MQNTYILPEKILQEFFIQGNFFQQMGAQSLYHLFALQKNAVLVWYECQNIEETCIAKDPYSDWVTKLLTLTLLANMFPIHTESK